MLTGSGAYTNTASVEGNEGTGTKTSNEVIVNIAAEPKFTIEKLQEIEGSKAGFTKSELSGKDGQTVDYEVIVKNTGNVIAEIPDAERRELRRHLAERRSHDPVRRRKPTPATTYCPAPAPTATRRASKAPKIPEGTKTSNEVS